MATTQDQSRRPETPTGMDISNPNKVRTAVLTDWASVRGSLPAPGEVWRWGDTDMSHKTLYTLKDADLIAKAESGDSRWRTTATLWEYVKRTAWPYEDVETGVQLIPEGTLALIEEESSPSQATASQAMPAGTRELRGEWSEATVSTRSLTRPTGKVY